MWQEALEVIPRMWTEDPFPAYEGKHFQIPERSVIPKPIQKPHPPLWVAATTLCFLPAIRAARGKILNVASVAAYFPGGPGMAVYYASKSFILSFSRALAELRSQGVVVSALCPGLTKTGFQARAGFGPNMDVARLPASTAMDVAEAGYAGLIAGRREIVPDS